MFERESGDFDPEFDGQPQSAAEEGTEHQASEYPPVPPAEPRAEPGNRPANSALRSSSASQASAGWRASDAATDFLGLDEEIFIAEPLESEFTQVTDGYDAHAAHDAYDAYQAFDASGRQVESSQPAPYLAQGEPPPGVDRESWLMGLDDDDLVAGVADPELELPEQLDASYSEPNTKGRVGTWVVRGAAVAAVLAVCVTLIQLYSTSDAPLPEPPVPIEPTQRPLAQNPGLTRPVTDGERETPAPVGSGEEGSAAVQREGLTNNRPPQPGFDPSLQGETTAEAIERAIRESQGVESVAADVGGEVQLDPSGEPSAPDKLDPTGDARGVRDPFDEVAPDAPGSATTTHGAGSTPVQGSQPGPVIVSGELTAQDSGPRSDNGLRYASMSELAGLWDGTTIPIEAVSGPTRVVTPNVGRVRAVLTSGEVFEGSMYAVGEDRIWIDNGLGRMALLGSSLSKVEHVLSDPNAPGLGEPGSQQYAGLPRVRARAPGGVFFGRLIHTEGNRVTLITEEGARLTLVGAEVDPAPSTKRVIVKGYEKEP